MPCYFQVLFLACFVAAINGADIQQTVRLKGRNIGAYDTYEANFSFTIENFLGLPYYKENAGVFSPAFPASNNTDDISWRFVLYPRNIANNGGPVVVGVGISIRSLPPHALYILASLECGIVDSWGQEQFVQKIQDAELIARNYGILINAFIERKILVSKAKELLPGSKLNLKCIVKGLLPYGNVPDDKIMYFEQTTLTEEPSAFDCGREIAADTIERLSEGDFNVTPDIVLESGGKQFKRHKAVLSARSPIFNEIFQKPDNFLDVVTVFNFTDEMNAVELEDMLTFLYQGTATRLDQSCRTLFVVAQKYQLDCLKVTCEEVLMKEVNAGNALDLQ